MSAQPAKILDAPTHHPAVGTAHGLRMVGTTATDPVGGAPVTAVHVDGATLWVLTSGRDLWRVADGHADVVASLESGATASCVGTHGGAVFVGGDEARLWHLARDRFEEVASFQDAPTRAEWHTPWGGPPAVFSMASDGTDLYVSVHVGGILRSADGAAWAPTIDLHDDVHQVAVGPDRTVWAATGSRALAVSSDRGATWRYHSEGLHGHYLLAVAVVADGVLVAASSGHAGRDGAIYRFDGGRFTRGRGLPAMDGAVGPRQLAATGQHAVVALPNGDLYASHDAGQEWSLLATGLEGVSEVALSTIAA
jgi:hypothetical protein